MDQSLDCISVLNRIPKLNNDKPPYEVLTGLQPDHLRGFHVKWGEPVVVEKAKGISSDLSVTGQWSVVVSSIINGGLEGVFYLKQENMHIISIARQWVLESLKDQSSSMTSHRILIPKSWKPYQMNNENDKVQTIRDHEQTQVVMQSIKSMKDVWNDASVKIEKS